ncbi:hypothetical protein CBL_12468 [Carabus blaptoides fortunei]
MASFAPQLLVVAVLLFCCAFVKCEDTSDTSAMEEGRTFVHHAMKRLAILIPIFLFKFGIMFTMLLVTAITSTKGLLVGTLLLALGVGHFIASKFSAVATPTAHISLPHYSAAYHTAPHFLEREHIASAPPSGYAQAQAYGAWRN